MCVYIACMYIVYVYMCICMYMLHVCVYVDIYTYIDTHIDTYKQPKEKHQRKNLREDALQGESIRGNSLIRDAYEEESNKGE